MTNVRFSLIIVYRELRNVGEKVKNDYNNVPMVVVKRLPRYYRYLGELLKQGVSRVSSATLSEMMGLTASQIRQDFNCFGGFGQQGYGYNVSTLYAEIGEILGLKNGNNVIIIGAGNMGRALVNSTKLEKRGFYIVGIFDNNPDKVGTEIKGVTVSSDANLEEFCSKHHVDIAALSLPAAGVKEVADRLVKCGVKGLWNFSYTELSVPEDVAVENVHLSDSLMTLSYKIAQNHA